MKWSEELCKRVSNFIRRYRSYEFGCLYDFFFITFCHVLLVPFFCHCIYVCMFCMLLFNFVNYEIFVVFMYSYCYVCSVLYILFHYVILCVVGL